MVFTDQSKATNNFTHEILYNEFYPQNWIWAIRKKFIPRKFSTLQYIKSKCRNCVYTLTLFTSLTHTHTHTHMHKHVHTRFTCHPGPGKCLLSLPTREVVRTSNILPPCSKPWSSLRMASIWNGYTTCVDIVLTTGKKNNLGANLLIAHQYSTNSGS